MEEGVLKIGGNRIKYWLGKKIKKWGDSLLNSGKYKVVTNPSSKLINPFTLMINFTVDGDKYQLILEGDYKDRYRELGEDGIINIEEKDLFFSISQYQNKWFKKS